jgi:hypothetical protein
VRWNGEAGKSWCVRHNLCKAVGERRLAEYKDVIGILFCMRETRLKVKKRYLYSPPGMYDKPSTMGNMAGNEAIVLHT